MLNFVFQSLDLFFNYEEYALYVHCETFPIPAHLENIQKCVKVQTVRTSAFMFKHNTITG